jgi:transposase
MVDSGMAENLVNVDRDTPMLLPVDLRQWVPENDLVHFVISAVDSMNLSAVSVNTRGSGSKQYPPRMMLALLIYCYCNGLFASRRIERATYRDVAVRYLTGDTHPDHDTICEFRRENGKVVKEAFVEVLHLGRQMGLVKVGMVSVDGTHIKANAPSTRVCATIGQGNWKSFCAGTWKSCCSARQKRMRSPLKMDRSCPRR